MLPPTCVMYPYKVWHHLDEFVCPRTGQSRCQGECFDWWKHRILSLHSMHAAYMLVVLTLLHKWALFQAAVGWDACAWDSSRAASFDRNRNLKDGIKRHYYSFKIFPRFWLAKSMRIIYHNQLLMTKFWRILRLINRRSQKCSPLAG